MNLRARIQPLADQLADELCDLVMARVERELERVREALHEQLSSVASDIAGEVVPVRAAEPPPDVARAPRPHAPLVAKKPIVCSKCGFVGGNARGCGTAHETQRAIDGGASDDTKADRLDTLRKRAGRLPVPSSSWRVDSGEVRELDFGASP